MEKCAKSKEQILDLNGSKKELRFNEESSLFAVERDKGLESIIGNIYQSSVGQDIYKSIEKKVQISYI